ncbi:hypothetical protein ACFVJH_27450 [Streptomyces decoyicus]|uniref:hypothetical protein n=1 Tax=Streptomyces decoyicus TaxID=249567 RepID=UPI003642843B
MVALRLVVPSGGAFVELRLVVPCGGAFVELRLVVPRGDASCRAVVALRLVVLCGVRQSYALATGSAIPRSVSTGLS